MQALTLCFSRDTLRIVDNLGLTTAQRGKTRDIIAAIERHVDGQINESVECHKFRRRIQQPGETFDDYLVSLRDLAKTCNEECTLKNIRDQIIEGLLDGNIVERLLQEKNLTLEVTITRCRGLEAAKRQRAEMSGNSSDSPVSVRKTYLHAGGKRSCPGCGANFHTGGRRQCPAYNMTCRKCNKIGHMAKVCKIRPAQPAKQSQPATNAVTMPDIMAAISHQRDHQRPLSMPPQLLSK